jgi:hypothetical protein
VLDNSTVTARFLVISGISETDARINALCGCSALKIGEMLRSSASETDERVIYAAACDAYYQWVLIGCAASDEAFKSMKAGDITLTSDSKSVLSAAKQLKESSLNAILPMLRDDSFYFSEVDADDA